MRVRQRAWRENVREVRDALAVGAGDGRVKGRSGSVGSAQKARWVGKRVVGER